MRIQKNYNAFAKRNFQTNQNSAKVLKNMKRLKKKKKKKKKKKLKRREQRKKKKKKKKKKLKKKKKKKKRTEEEEEEMGNRASRPTEDDAKAELVKAMESRFSSIGLLSDLRAVFSRASSSASPVTTTIDRPLLKVRNTKKGIRGSSVFILHPPPPALLR
jgi:outer membrane biosynthesis protein TonB